MQNPNHQPKYPVQTLGKALDILVYMKDNPSQDGYTIGQLSTELNMGKSVIHRLLDTLLSYKFVEKMNNNIPSYRLGWGIYEIGSVVATQHTLSSSIYVPALEKLCADLCETINYGIFTNQEVMVLYQSQPNTKIRINIQMGNQEPPYATSLGKLFMTQLTNEELQSYFESTNTPPLTNKTITTYEGMAKEVKKIIKQGYSMDNEELCSGLICYGMPIKNYNNQVIAGVSVSGPAERMTKGRKQEILDALRVCCLSLSHSIGYSKDILNL